MLNWSCKMRYQLSLREEFRKFYAFIIAMLIFFWCSQIVIGTVKQNQSNIGGKNAFHYIIISNQIDDNKITNIPRRRVSVLIPQDSFSENTVREIFTRVGVRFPDPVRLEIMVFTSLYQIKSPEEADIGAVSEEKSDNIEFHSYH